MEVIQQDFILLPKNNEENISIIVEIEKNPKIYFLAKDKKNSKFSKWIFAFISFSYVFILFCTKK